MTDQVEHQLACVLEAMAHEAGPECSVALSIVFESNTRKVYVQNAARGPRGELKATLKEAVESFYQRLVNDRLSERTRIQGTLNRLDAGGTLQSRTGESR